MFDLIFQTRLMIGKIADLPHWVLMAGSICAVMVGSLIGRGYWRQFRAHAVMIELETRRAQSEFDLVSRDVTKIKQEVTAQLGSRNLKI